MEQLNHESHTQPKRLPRTPSLRFTKSQRLLNASDYSRVFSHAPFRASHPQFLLLANSNEHSIARLGLIIAKKHVKHANKRNRLKRLIRESFREQQHILPSIDAIVLARKGADTLSNTDITRIINGLWKRVIKKARQTNNSHSEHV